jgi:hypothetical protein
MRVLFLGVYKNLSYRNLIYISLVELIAKDMAYFKNGKLVIKNKQYLTKTEGHILHKVKLNTQGKVFVYELENWYSEIKNELIELNYIKKYPILGYFFTRLFKKNIKISIKQELNPNIIEFINSGKIVFLKSIINDIEEVKIPICDKKSQAWTHYYYDTYEMNMEARGHRHGIFNYVQKRKGVTYE